MRKDPVRDIGDAPPDKADVERVGERREEIVKGADAIRLAAEQHLTPEDTRVGG
ncbi:MAG TPA: hypothetical protein VKE96_12910 [Vicinamibacterales bacterium]|nr:hypothetical protein [Vicinamibacterales bacterium]